MSRSGRNEVKRAAAQYLNGLAVAVLSLGCLGPAVSQAELATWIPIGAVAVSVGLHVAALALVHRLEE